MQFKPNIPVSSGHKNFHTGAKKMELPAEKSALNSSYLIPDETIPPINYVCLIEKQPCGKSALCPFTYE
jgi:hypothetical protein